MTKNPSWKQLDYLCYPKINRKKKKSQGQFFYNKINLKHLK